MAETRIRLTTDLPLNVKHGMKEGREFTVIRTKHEKPKSFGSQGRTYGYWVMGDAGEEVLVHRHEADVISEEE